jgi:hypothetical protein
MVRNGTNKGDKHINEGIIPLTFRHINAKIVISLHDTYSSEAHLPWEAEAKALGRQRRLHDGSDDSFVGEEQGRACEKGGIGKQ